MSRRLSSPAALLLGLLAWPGPALAQPPPDKVPVQWDKVTMVSKTTATLQVVVNPPLRRGSAIHDNAYKSLRDLQADYVRYVPWLPYPRLGVAELEPPRDGRTSWDFSIIDPMTVDFLEATRGHSVILNFSTIPQWMAKTDKPVAYPSDPDQVTWDYTQGTEFHDPTFKQVADYYARLLAWYTQGGFTDELGKRHESGHRYPIPLWEVLNEVDFEHSMSPETYTRLYDAVVEAMRRVQPGLKFVGTALAIPGRSPEFFEYFLNPANHRPGIPLDYVSYHFYAIPVADQTPDVQQHTFFAQADGFLNVVRYIEVIRKRLSPKTGTMINEIGAISADDVDQDKPGHVAQPIPNSYWNLAGAMYAYIFGELTRMGIEVAGESQLVGYPTQFPSVSMVDWTTGQPNARYRVLQLLHDNFGPGDKLVANAQAGPFPPPLANYVYYQGFVTRDGKRRLLLVNKRDRTIDVSVPGATGGRVDVVDETTASGPAASRKLDGETVSLGGYAVSVVTMP
jgi:glycosyl hydrolase family 39 (putative alpha-L-iduronidase)